MGVQVDIACWATTLRRPRPQALRRGQFQSWRRPKRSRRGASSRGGTRGSCRRVADARRTVAPRRVVRRSVSGPSGARPADRAVRVAEGIGAAPVESGPAGLAEDHRADLKVEARSDRRCAAACGRRDARRGPRARSSRSPSSLPGTVSTMRAPDTRSMRKRRLGGRGLGDALQSDDPPTGEDDALGPPCTPPEERPRARRSSASAHANGFGVEVQATTTSDGEGQQPPLVRWREQHDPVLMGLAEHRELGRQKGGHGIDLRRSGVQVADEA